MKVVKSRDFRAPFPLLGLPIDGVYGTYVAIPLETVCRLRMNFKVVPRGNHAEAAIYGVGEPLRAVVERFLIVFLEAAAVRAMLVGDISVECKDSVPLVSQYAIVTNAVVESLLGLDELRKNLTSIALIDSEVLEIDPGYMLALRCVLSTKMPCAARGPNEVVTLKMGTPIMASEVAEVAIHTLQNRGVSLPKIMNTDRRVLSLYLKMVSTVMPMVIDLIEAGRDEGKKYLRLVLYTELALSDLSLDKLLEYPKVVSDIGGYRIYEVKIGSESW